jgi:hypothetical protein
VKPPRSTLPYRWPSPPGKTCPRRGRASMSRRVRWGSTQLNAGSVDSGFAALMPLAQSGATSRFRCRNSSDTSTRHVLDRRMHRAISLDRVARLICRAVTLPLLTSARRLVVDRPRSRRSAVPNGAEDVRTKALSGAFVGAYGPLTWDTPRSCLRVVETAAGLGPVSSPNWQRHRETVCRPGIIRSPQDKCAAVRSHGRCLPYGPFVPDVVLS